MLAFIGGNFNLRVTHHVQCFTLRVPKPPHLPNMPYTVIKQGKAVVRYLPLLQTGIMGRSRGVKGAMPPLPPPRFCKNKVWKRWPPLMATGGSCFLRHLPFPNFLILVPNCVDRAFSFFSQKLFTVSDIFWSALKTKKHFCLFVNVNYWTISCKLLNKWRFTHLNIKKMKMFSSSWVVAVDTQIYTKNNDNELCN